MKNSSFGTKCLLLAVTLGVLAYFGIQGLQYLGDPLTPGVQLPGGGGHGPFRLCGAPGAGAGG